MLNNTISREVQLVNTGSGTALVCDAPKTIVRYSRKLKKWFTINGDVVQSFPAGNDGKLGAMLAALSIDHPQLGQIVADIVSQHDEGRNLLGRLINAAKLMVKGNVYTNGRVRSQSNPDETYIVSYSGIPAGYHCTCQDFENGLQRQAGIMVHGGVDTAYGLMCKHTLASLLNYLSGGQYAKDEAIPFAPNHHNANLTDYDRQRLRKQAERDQATARARLARMDQGNGYNGYGGPRQ